MPLLHNDASGAFLCADAATEIYHSIDSAPIPGLVGLGSIVLSARLALTELGLQTHDQE